MNLCIFSGRIGKDCEVRQTQAGASVGSFSLAVNCGFGDHKRTEWLNCVLWKRDGVYPHLTKGKAITITGELQTRKWQDQQGTDRQTTEIIVRELEFQQGGDRQQQGQAPQGNAPQQGNFPSEASEMETIPF